MNVQITTIPHKHQRYDTCGDWQFDGFGNLTMRISDTGDHRSNFLIAVHELVEAYLCKVNGISEAAVDSWDFDHKDHPDPGSIPQCPYFREHMLAEAIERILAPELDLSWAEHTINIVGLG